MSKPRLLLCSLATACLGTGLLHAASGDELKRNCGAVSSDQKKLLSNLETCITDIFTLDTIHPIVQSIVPGGGTGPGLSLTLDKRGEWRSTFNVNGAISLREYWRAEMKDTLVHRKFFGQQAGNHGESFRHPSSTCELAAFRRCRFMESARTRRLPAW